MRARDQSSIFSTGGKFRPNYGLLLELHALTLVTCSCALKIYSCGRKLIDPAAMYNHEVFSRVLAKLATYQSDPLVIIPLPTVFVVA